MKLREYVQVFSNRRMAVTFFLGISSSIPLPLVTGTMDVWLTRVGVDIKTIGLFSLVQLPYTLKPLWAPLLDKYSPHFLHRRGGWIFLFQVLLTLGIAAMSFQDPTSHTLRFAAIALIVSALSASQDIVIDAYRAELFSKKEMAAGVAIAVVGLRIALLISGSLAVIMSDYISWNQIYGAMAVIMLLMTVASFFSPRPEQEEAPPKSLQDAFIQPLLNFFQRPKAWQILLFVLLYKLGDVVAGKMTSTFLLKIGFTGTEVGGVNKGFGMIVTIVSGLIGGGLVARWGIIRSLWIFGILQGVSNLMFVLQAEVGRNFPLMVACIGVENICGSLGTVAFVAFLMSLCDRHYTATQYALLSSLMAVTRSLVSTPTGYLQDWVGWPMYFAISAVLALPGLFFLTRIRGLLEDAVQPAKA